MCVCHKETYNDTDFVASSYVNVQDCQDLPGGHREKSDVPA